MSETPAPRQRVRLRPLRDDWDDLLELLEDLQGYTGRPQADLYDIVQAIAEGESVEVDVEVARRREFAEHMREFDLEVTPLS